MKSIQLPRAFFALALLTSVAIAQPPTVINVMPQAAAPGDLVIIEGTNLSTITGTRFIGNVGGFVGVSTADAIPQLVTATRIEVIVPQIPSSWAPPGASGAPNPVGTIDLLDPNGRNLPVPFHFIQAWPETDTIGLGSTQPGIGRAVCSFTLAGGAPVAGNGSFTLTLENAIPSAVVFLAAGAPAANPSSLPVADGFVGIDILSPYQLLPGFVADIQGEIALPAPLPPVLSGIDIAVQWLILDPGTLAPYISNALKTEV